MATRHGRLWCLASSDFSFMAGRTTSVFHAHPFSLTYPDEPGDHKVVVTCPGCSQNFKVHVRVRTDSELDKESKQADGCWVAVVYFIGLFFIYGIYITIFGEGTYSTTARAVQASIFLLLAIAAFVGARFMTRAMKTRPGKKRSYDELVQVFGWEKDTTNMRLHLMTD